MISLKRIVITLCCCLLFMPVCSEATTSNSVTIGALYNLTGAQSVLDKESVKGAELAIKEINATGGILGKQLQLKTLDCKSKPSVVTKNAEKLAKSKDIADFIIGFNDTDMALAAIPTIAAAKKILVTSGATSPKLTALAPQSVLYTCFVDSDQAIAAAEFAHDKLAATTAIIIEQSDMEYSQLLSNYFQSRFNRLGGTILATTKTESNKYSLTSAIKEWHTQKLNPDIFFVAAGPDTVLSIVQQLRKAGLQQPIVGGDSFDIDTILGGKTALNNIYFTTHGFITENNHDADVVKFITDFKKAYRKKPDSSFSGLGYDTIKLLALAIKNAGSFEGTKVRTALLGIKNYNGITGTISYSDSNPFPAKTVTIVQLQNNNKSFVEERLPKTSS